MSTALTCTITVFSGLLFFSGVALGAPDARQITLLANNCIQCHAAEHTGAPQLGKVEDWLEIIAKGEEAVMKNVVEGIGGMPPLGYCSGCSEQDLRVLMHFVSGMPTTDSYKSGGEQ